MIHAFRSFTILLHNPWAKPVDPIKPFKHSFRVMPWDCDMNIHLTNARYPQQLDLARTRFLMKIGTGLLFAKMGWRSVLASQVITFIREIKPFALVNIESRVLHWDRKYFYMESRFMVEGKVHAKAIARIAMIKNGRVSSFTQMLKDVAKVHKLTAPTPESPSLITQTDAMTELLNEMRKADEETL